MNMYQFNQQRKLDKERMGYEKDRVNMEQERVNMTKEQYAVENTARAEEARLRAAEHEQSMINYSLMNKKSQSELDQFNADLAFRKNNPAYLDFTNDNTDNPTAIDPRLMQEYLPLAIGKGLTFKDGSLMTTAMQNYMIPGNNDMATAQMNEYGNTRNFGLEEQKHKDTASYQNRSLNMQGVGNSLAQQKFNQETEDRDITKAKTIDASMTAMYQSGSLKSPSLLYAAWNMPKGAAQVNALNAAYKVARQEAQDIAKTEKVSVDAILDRLRSLASTSGKWNKTSTEYDTINKMSPIDNAVKQGRGRN